MEIQDIKNKIKRILLECVDIDISDSDFEMKLLDVGLNSLLFIKLLVNLEKELDIEFEEELINPSYVTNLNQLAQIIEKM